MAIQIMMTLPTNYMVTYLWECFLFLGNNFVFLCFILYLELLEMFIKMIACPTDLLKSEGALLKNLHIIATDLMQVFDPVRLR